MIFAAGILHGGVFPEMYGAIAPSKIPVMTGAVTLDAFLTRIGPVSFRDYSLLIVWSFVAGFFERLVPDVLSRLAQQAEKTVNASRPMTTVANGRTLAAPAELTRDRYFELVKGQTNTKTISSPSYDVAYYGPSDLSRLPFGFVLNGDR